MGVVPRTAFKRAFVVRKDDTQLHPLDIYPLARQIVERSYALEP